MARTVYPQTSERLDLSAITGDDWGMRMTLTDASAVAINLTGYTWVSAIYNGATTVQTITVAASDPTNGIIDLSLTDTETTALGGVYTWSITWTSGTDTFTPVAGQFQFFQRGAGF